MILPFGDQGHYRLIGLRIEFSRISERQAGLATRIFNQCNLHAETDAQIWNLAFTGETGCCDLAFDTALTKAAWHQNRIVLGQCAGAVGFDFFRIQVFDVDPAAGMNTGVAQGFSQRLVRFGQVDIFADHADSDFVGRVFQRVHQLGPDREVCRLRRQAQLFADDRIQPLVVQHLRDLVDSVSVPHRNHGVFLDVREQGNLGPLVVRNRTVGTAQQCIWRNTDFAQFLHTMLGRLGLQFTGRYQIWHQGQMDESGSITAGTQAQLTRCFEERQGFDITDGTADFHQRHVETFGAAIDVILDFIGDMRNDLHRLAEVLAPAFLADHGFVDLAGSEIIHLLHLGRNEALIVAEVEIGLCAIVGHKHFAVLERAHGAWIDVDVRIEFKKGDFKAARF